MASWEEGPIEAPKYRAWNIMGAQNVSAMMMI